MNGQARAAAAVVLIAVAGAIPQTLRADPQLDGASGSETIVEIQVHGNAITPADVIQDVSGLAVGTEPTAAVLEAAATRLRDSGEFQQVEILKRFASITDASQIVLVILVDEGPVRLEGGRDGQPARLVRQGGLRPLFLPLLDAEDGYGPSYGVQFALAEPLGRDTRLSLPLTWGGDRRAAAELEMTFEAGPIDRVVGGVAAQRREHPFFEEPFTRQRTWLRAERAPRTEIRVGGEVAWQDVSLLEVETGVLSVGADVTIDTRLNPRLPRNAVYARAAVERLAFASGPVTQVRLEANGYLGVAGPTVIVVRAVREVATGPLPAYFKSMVGGNATLRGFRAGYAIGDSLAVGSLEIRHPLTSPVNVGQLGVSAFVDNGVAYDRGRQLRKQRFDTGVGGSMWLSGGVFRLDLAVARGMKSGTRVHFSGGFLF